MKGHGRPSASFIDIVEIATIGGDGGDGCSSFRREKYVPRGGPDGGDGGKGGDVVVRVDPHLGTLIDYRYRRTIRGERGGHGKGKNQHGRDGADAIVRVPPGTVIRDAVTGEVIRDLADVHQEIVAAGGRGGRGNAAFATAVDRAPTRSEEGGRGQRRRLVLEVKIIADVGIVGLPNVGKSSLLRRLTRATPKIGDYPFTTLSPNLGVLSYGERDVVLADIPGLVEGAHSGKGLGHEFLRHIERTKVLLLLLDATRTDLDSDLKALLEEISLYDSRVARKPRLVVVNKVDLLSKDERKALGESAPGLLISAVTGYGLRTLVKCIVNMVDIQEKEGGAGDGTGT